MYPRSSAFSLLSPVISNSTAHVVVADDEDEVTFDNVKLAVCIWYGIIICIGSGMNVYVLYRTKRLHRRDPEQFRNGIGICLCFMASANFVALLALLMHSVITIASDSLPEIVYDALCKIMMFASHTAYTQSMWCWFFMSALRFIATQRPLQYTTLWRLPYLALSAAFVGAMIENAYLLISVSGGKYTCEITTTMSSRVYWSFHVVISFVTPALLILYMDISVLFCSITKTFGDPMLQIVINRPCGEKKKLIRRFVVITVSCLCFNAPENLIRILVASGQDIMKLGVPYGLLQLSQILYYTQFAFNAFYLTTFVYEKSLMSKTNSSRQLSISFRQRLEENGHLLRERANTVSYRATSSMPTLVRNSSCCALDQLGPQKHWL
uniref:G_PROTEIN_RECEP_F1_2 domain-containing protein n=1 Tax=Panagrellus redivivus TaxID=6233 RepID=A0A7E4VFG9_PANRE